jgi:hypothetical protein
LPETSANIRQSIGAIFLLQTMSERHHTASFLLVMALGLFLYLPLLTRNYDINGLMEASAVESGNPADLWNPNHMLYRPVGYLVRQTLAGAGIHTDVIPFLQVLSAVFGALGLGFVFLALEHLTANRTIAIWMSMALGVSWSYWTLSTDVYYFSMAAMFVAASLAIFVRSDSVSSLIACGLLAGLSILACQANVVLLPGLGIAVLLRNPSHPVRKSIQGMLWIWISASAAVGIAFVGAAILVYQRRTIAEILQWATSYSGTRLPMWGTWWPPTRLLQTAGSAFKSVLAMDFWMFPFFLRHLKNGELPFWIAPLGFIFMAGILIVAFRKSSGDSNNRNRTLLWLLMLYGTYIPFVTWWESIEARWFIVPNIFLTAFTAIILSHWSKWPYFKIALPAGVLILAGMNLVISAGPKHFRESNPSKMAACVADHMNSNDLFIATEWNWADYLHYIHSREMVSFIGEVSAASRNKEIAMEKIESMVRERRQQGAHVYMTDIASYPADHMRWLSEQTGLTAEDLRRYKGSPAFQCVGSNFIRLE